MSLAVRQPWTLDALQREPPLRRSALLGDALHVSHRTVVAVAGAGVLACGAAAARGVLAGVVAVGATMLVLTVLRYPPVAGYASVAVVPVVSGLRRGFPVPGLRISEVLVVGFFALVAFTALVHRRPLVRWQGVDGWLIAYALGTILLPAWHVATSGATGSMASMFLPLQFVLFLWTVRAVLTTVAQRTFALRLLLLAALPVVGIAVLQQFDVGPARSLVERTTGSDALGSTSYAAYARATGPFQHWHPFAGYLTVVGLLAVALLLDHRQRVMSRRRLAIVLTAVVAGLMCSITFTTMIGMAAGSLVLGLRAGKLRQSVTWLLGGVVVAGVVFSSMLAHRVEAQYSNADGSARSSLVPETIQKRLDVWTDEYLPGMSGHWALGFGPGLPDDVEWTHTESEYVTVVLRGGLPLLVAFAGSLVALQRTARRAAAASALPAAAVALATTVGVLWVMDLVYPYLTSSGLPQPLWALAGIVLVDRTVSERARLGPRSERSAAMT